MLPVSLDCPPVSLDCPPVSLDCPPVSLDCPVLIVLSVFSNDYYQPILNIFPFFWLKLSLNTIQHIKFCFLMFTWLNESTTYLRGNRKHYYAIVLTHNNCYYT
jgi:hypothetical protein